MDFLFLYHVIDGTGGFSFGWFDFACTETEILCDEYRKTCNISRTLVGNKIVDNSDAVGAWPVGAAPATSSFST